MPKILMAESILARFGDNYFFSIMFYTHVKIYSREIYESEEK